MFLRKCFIFFFSSVHSKLPEKWKTHQQKFIFYFVCVHCIVKWIEYNDLHHSKVLQKHTAAYAECRPAQKDTTYFCYFCALFQWFFFCICGIPVVVIVRESPGEEKMKSIIWKKKKKRSRNICLSWHLPWDRLLTWLSLYLCDSSSFCSVSFVSCLSCRMWYIRLHSVKWRERNLRIPARGRSQRCKWNGQKLKWISCEICGHLCHKKQAKRKEE